jgi:exodeoxyribonuclease III
VKVATFNVNDINKRLPDLLASLQSTQPDVACLQELKATDAAFPADVLNLAGYGAVWRGERSWNGVAILARGAEPVLIRDALPGDPTDGQSRYLEVAVNGVVIASIYLPNGNPQPGPKFDYKLDWFDRLLEHAARLLDQEMPVVLAGDYNVVSTDFDFYSVKSSKTRCSNPRRATRTPSSSRWDGPTRFASRIRTNRCSHSGAICATDGRATPDCGWTICSSARRSRHGSKLPASIVMFAENRTPAITHPLGSNSRPHQSQRENRDDGNWPGSTDMVVVDGSNGSSGTVRRRNWPWRAEFRSHGEDPNHDRGYARGQ